MAIPTTKAELVAQGNASQKQLERTIAPIDPARMVEPGVNGAWSIKDTLAHLTFWNRNTLLRLRAAVSDSTPDPSSFVQSDAQIDEWNARCYEENKDRPLDAVLIDFRDTYARVIDALESLSDADLFDPNRFAWTRGNALWTWVAGNISEHYPDHREQIERFLTRRAGGAP